MERTVNIVDRIPIGADQEMQSELVQTQRRCLEQYYRQCDEQSKYDQRQTQGAEAEDSIAENPATELTATRLPTRQGSLMECCLCLLSHHRRSARKPGLLR